MYIIYALNFHAAADHSQLAIINLTLTGLPALAKKYAHDYNRKHTVSHSRENLEGHGFWLSISQLEDIYVQLAAPFFNAVMVKCRAGATVTALEIKMCNGIIMLAMFVESTASRAAELPGLSQLDVERGLVSGHLTLTHHKTCSTTPVKVLMLTPNIKSLLAQYRDGPRVVALKGRAAGTPPSQVFLLTAAGVEISSPSRVLEDTVRELTGNDTLKIGFNSLRALEATTAVENAAAPGDLHALELTRAHSKGTADRYYVHQRVETAALAAQRVRAGILGFKTPAGLFGGAGAAADDGVRDQRPSSFGGAGAAADDGVRDQRPSSFGAGDQQQAKLPRLSRTKRIVCSDDEDADEDGDESTSDTGSTIAHRAARNDDGAAGSNDDKHYSNSGGFYMADVEIKAKRLKLDVGQDDNAAAAPRRSPKDPAANVE
jgi:hypothetical protein